MKNKTIWIVVVVLLAIGGYFWLKSGGSLGMPGPVTVATATPTATAAPAKSGGAKATATPAPAAAQTYTQLVAAYQNRTVQFNDACQATPKSFVLKNNTSILLDNRSKYAHVIGVDGKSYSLGAYGYQVVTLSSSSLPHTLGFNCGSSVNVGTVMLEADISGQ